MRTRKFLQIHEWDYAYSPLCESAMTYLGIATRPESKSIRERAAANHRVQAPQRSLLCLQGRPGNGKGFFKVWVQPYGIVHDFPDKVSINAKWLLISA